MSIVSHKKARLEYELLDKYEAGIELFGFEVKSIRGGHAKLEGSRVLVRGGEAFVVGMHVSPYQPGNTPSGYDPSRSRKLLLTKKEIAELSAKVEERGLTIIPINIFIKNNQLKLEVALARGKKKYDKREDLKKKESGRRIQRIMKGER